MRTDKKDTATVKNKRGGCRDQATYEAYSANARANAQRSEAMKKEKEMLEKTSLKDLIK
jgi:hypothetical protein